MSHAFCLVAIPASVLAGDTESFVARLMQPFDENLEHDCPRGEANDWEAECATCDRSWWDWWQIGGRWTGVFDDYEPRLDPDNVETCSLCRGTGMRDDPGAVAHRLENPDYTCNGCNGVGVDVKWPTDWKPHPGDRQPYETVVSAYREGKCLPFRFLIAEQVVAREEWDGRAFIETPDFNELTLRAVTAARGCDFVVVDYHS
jgi:hypothetical protein